MQIDWKSAMHSLDGALKPLNAQLKAKQITFDQFRSAVTKLIDHFERVVEASHPIGDRRSEAEEVALFGNDAPRYIILMLDAPTSADAAEALMRAGPSSIPVLLEVLAIGNTYARAGALWALADKTMSDPRSVGPALNAIAKEKHPYLRTYASVVLGHSQDSSKRNEVRAALTAAALHDSDADVRDAASWALAGRAWRTDDPDDVSAASRALLPLARSGDADAQSVIQELLKQQMILAAMPYAVARHDGFVPENFTVEGIARASMAVVKEILKATAVDLAVDIIKDGLERWRDSMRAMNERINAENAEFMRSMEERARIDRIVREQREHFERELSRTADGRTDLARPAIERDRDHYA
ncbi:HEAT repeat domain-containing protein [Sorangium sp. So ce117]|uniref:HEAT repeat domain-containing protein n=1 Tax=Sorangium sp. So ce117 TaxID=3133277 RepID=UPI003F5E2021